MQKIKVFHFPFRDSNSGVLQYVLNNWLHTNREQFQYEFGTVGAGSAELKNKIERAGCKLHHISCYAENDLDQFKREVRELFQREKYDIVHLHTSFWKSFLMEEIALECGVPKIIVHSHSTRVDIEDEAKRQEAERLHAIRRQEFNTSLATDFWACSHAAADWLYGPQIPRERIQVMNNAIDVKKFAFDPVVREQYRQKLGLEGCFVVGHVGRMSYTKNQTFLLDVFLEVSRQFDNIKLLLIGDGELRQSLLRQTEELGISDKVLFLGNRSDVPQLLQAMDVFCLPSRFEGLGIVLVEAQTSGLKCLASDAVPHEAVLTENLELLPLKVDGWVCAICNIFKGYLRKDMCPQVLATDYNIEQQIKEVERLYRS